MNVLFLILRIDNKAYYRDNHVCTISNFNFKYSEFVSSGSNNVNNYKDKIFNCYNSNNLPNHKFFNIEPNFFNLVTIYPNKIFFEYNFYSKYNFLITHTQSNIFNTLYQPLIL